MLVEHKINYLEFDNYTVRLSGMKNTLYIDLEKEGKFKHENIPFCCIYELDSTTGIVTTNRQQEIYDDVVNKFIQLKKEEEEKDGLEYEERRKIMNEIFKSKDKEKII
jgi:hypothetical protein